MEKAKLQRLLHQYLDNSISEKDCIELLNYLDKADMQEISDEVNLDITDLDKGPVFSGEQAQDILNRIKADIRFKESAPIKSLHNRNLPKLYLRQWLQIAAAVLIFFFGGSLVFLLHKKHESFDSNKLAQAPKSIIVPGSTKASLILANGNVVYLQNVNNGLLAKTNFGNVVKTRNGQILYDTRANVKANGKQVGYNTLTTPRGGVYQVVLPDGTNVWLNAASSITYPIAFTGNERDVKLNGEAYFEVAKNKKKPFYVNINNVRVRVLGTHFNIAAYNDDNNITTTLLEGSVQVTKNKSLSLLKPGQQADISNSSDNIVVSEANINNAIAWKNGYFVFDDDDIAGIMRKVSRWYDVDIEYHGTFTDQKFGGTYYRSKSIDELLHHLEKISNINFSITGRRIIVMN